MLFADLPGYADLKHRLTEAAARKTLHHAILFAGLPGTPTVPLGLALAQYIFCEDKRPDDACGVCHPCRMVAKLAHPDLHFLFPVSGTDRDTADPSTAKLVGQFRTYLQEQPYGDVTDWGNTYGAGNRQPAIRADDVRALISTLSMQSYEGGYKVGLIWLPELMAFTNQVAANVFLKLLEEPPAKTIFILMSYGQDKLLPTIQSRVMSVRVRLAEDVEIEQLLLNKGIDLQRATAIAEQAEGSFAAANSLADAAQADMQDFFLVWMRMCFSANVGEVIKLAQTFTDMGREGQKQLISYSLGNMRKLLHFKMLPEQASYNPQLSKFFSAVSTSAVEPASRSMEQMYANVQGNVTPKLNFIVHSQHIMRALRMG